MQQISYYIFLVLIISLFSNCGRKQRNIFSFDVKKQFQIKKLSIPAVQGITAKRTSFGNKISWLNLDLTQKQDRDELFLNDKYLAGYNIYRLTRANIIPRRPLNNKPIKQTFFTDRSNLKKNNPTYYLVRAVFNFKNSKIEGPSSIIVKLQN